MLIDKQPYKTSIRKDNQSAFGYIRRQKWTNPEAASATAVHAAITLTATVGGQDITTGITNPTHARNVTAKGNASGNAGNVVITGTDLRGNVITETIALSGASEVLGNKAFKTITNIHVPAETHSGTDTVSIGLGSKLGLDRKMSGDEVFFGTVDGVYEATRVIGAGSTSAIESNTALFNTALANTKVYVAVFMAVEKTNSNVTTA